MTSMKIRLLQKLGPWLAILLLAQIALAQEPGGRLVVERIEIQGARKTRPHVIRRYLSFREGGVLTPELIERDYQSLLAINFFKRVDFSTAPGSEKGKVIVIVEVQERRLPTLEFAGGFSELDGWYVSPIGVRYDNLFGTGHFLGLRIVFGDRVSGLNFRFQQPRIFNSSLNFQFDFDALGRNFIHYFDNRDAIQKVGTGSLRLALSGARGVGKFISGGYQTSTAEPDSFAEFTRSDSTFRNFPPVIAKNLGRKEMGMFWLRLQADTRDHAFFPRRGLWGALSIEVADPRLGGDTRFTRKVFDGRFYQSLGNSVLALRLKAAATSESTPYYERFYLGGAYSLRGFADRSLTPVGYGTRLFLGNLEWRIPISGRDPRRPNLVGAVFFDAGSIGTPPAKFADDEILITFGFGVRIKVPVAGLLRLDFAYPEKRPEDFRFHLGIGHPF
jgi:outer membrane protein insertion porin family